MHIISLFSLQTKMAKLEAGDKSSKSLLTNVLDMDDDFLVGQLNNLAEGGERHMTHDMDDGFLAR